MHYRRPRRKGFIGRSSLRGCAAAALSRGQILVSSACVRFAVAGLVKVRRTMRAKVLGVSEGRVVG